MNLDALVRAAGLEPARPCEPQDFKSCVSTISPRPQVPVKAGGDYRGEQPTSTVCTKDYSVLCNKSACIFQLAFPLRYFNHSLAPSLPIR